MFSNPIENAIDEQLSTPQMDPEKGRRRSEIILVSMCDQIRREPVKHRKKRRRRRNPTLYSVLQAH
jgi:hypothetical protein